LTIHEGDLAVDHDVAVAAGALDASPLAVRRVVYHRTLLDSHGPTARILTVAHLAV
jgi:hypothetical protein